MRCRLTSPFVWLHMSQSGMRARVTRLPSSVGIWFWRVITEDTAHLSHTINQPLLVIPWSWIKRLWEAEEQAVQWIEHWFHHRERELVSDEIERRRKCMKTEGRQKEPIRREGRKSGNTMRLNIMTPAPLCATKTTLTTRVDGCI